QRPVLSSLLILFSSSTRSDIRSPFLPSGFLYILFLFTSSFFTLQLPGSHHETPPPASGSRPVFRLRQGSSLDSRCRGCRERPSGAQPYLQHSFQPRLLVRWLQY